MSIVTDVRLRTQFVHCGNIAQPTVIVFFAMTCTYIVVETYCLSFHYIYSVWLRVLYCFKLAKCNHLSNNREGIVNDEHTYLYRLKKGSQNAHKAWTRNETVTCHKQDAKPLIVLKQWGMSHISVLKYEQISCLIQILTEGDNILKRTIPEW